AKSARNKGRRFNRKLPPPARLPQASGPIAIRKTPTAGRRMADRAYRWVKRDNFVLEATPTPPTANGNLGQDLGKIRAKTKNRTFEDSFGKQTLIGHFQGQMALCASSPGAPDGQELLAPLAADGFPIEAGKLLQGIGDGLSGRG